MTAKSATFAFVLRADGSIEDLPLREPTLEEMQGLVGGYIELLGVRWLDQPAQLVMDEEGKLKDKPVNWKATVIARTAGIASWDLVVGDVLILTGKARLT